MYLKNYTHTDRQRFCVLIDAIQAGAKEDEDVFRLDLEFQANEEMRQENKCVYLTRRRASRWHTRAFRRPQISVHVVLKVSLKFMVQTGHALRKWKGQKSPRLRANYTPISCE